MAGLLQAGIHLLDDAPDGRLGDVVFLGDLVLALAVENLGDGEAETVVVVLPTRAVLQVNTFWQLPLLVELQLFAMQSKNEVEINFFESRQFKPTYVEIGMLYFLLKLIRLSPCLISSIASIRSGFFSFSLLM